MSLQSDYVKATLDARPLIDNGEWEKRCDAWIKKTIRAETLAEVEKIIEALPKRALLGWDGTQIYYIERDDILSAIQKLKEGGRG